VPLPETYPKGVVFIGHRSDGRDRLVGTGFFVSIRGRILQPTYVVTAAHVVEGAAQTFVRLRTTGGPRNVVIEDWFFHGVHDVAVAPIDVPFDHDMTTTGIEQFIDDPDALPPPLWGGIEVGDDVYFIGLLGKVKAMRDRLIPIVRTGVLGAPWVENVPVKRSPVDATRNITAHLIDCRSFGGFSGAPCYLQKSRAVAGDGGVNTQYRTLLLGLIGGHFDDWTSTKQRMVLVDDDDDDQHDDESYSISNDIKAPVSTGIGYVIPVEFARETLMRDELLKKRERDERPLEE
jgi:hypothetical protein